jgi:ABC-type multidrug transport system fused ATPase/permease subunit
LAKNIRKKPLLVMAQDNQEDTIFYLPLESNRIWPRDSTVSSTEGNNVAKVQSQDFTRASNRREIFCKGSSSPVLLGAKRGMILSFQQLAISFQNIQYFVDMPEEIKEQGVTEKRLHLLKDITGAFRPGVLTALMGVSGAGKTTLIDVLSGRKTGGHIEGDIRISGFPQVQETFALISGYCEQNDIHSPQVTVHESLFFHLGCALRLK